MGKISKIQMKKHQEALVILEKDVLNYYDKEFVFKHYHEGATNMNNLISAHFTPMQLALTLSQNVRNYSFVDLCAGTGKLAWYMVRQHDLENSHNKTPYIGICVELNKEYYRIGQKLVPEVHWINGSIFDKEVIDEILDYMTDISFNIISNPPYGRTVNPNIKDLLYYTGPEFEYKAIELGALLGASEGVFLIPQQSCPFKMSGQANNEFLKENEYSTKYAKFIKDTSLEISPNMGYCTDIYDNENGWKDVSIVTEIAIVEYEEYEYNPKYPIVKKKSIKSQTQLNLFDL